MRVQCPHPRLLLTALALLIAGLGGLPGALSAQQGSGAADTTTGPSGAPGRGDGGSQLDRFMQSSVDSAAQTPPYRREVFSYPRGGRLDPTTIPSTIASAGAFPDLKVTGIIHNAENPEDSRAIIRVLGESSERKVVRPGDPITESYRVEAIEPNRILIEVQLLGRTRQLVLDRGESTQSSSSNGN